MLGMLKRHEVEILLRAGHAKTEVVRLTGVSLCSVKRIAQESPVVHVDDAAERAKRQIGRPSTVVNFQKQVAEILQQTPDLASLEILRRVRETGYQGGKTALYALVASLRPKSAKPLVRFEGLPGEIQSARFWASGRGVSEWCPSAHPFLRLASEVLALRARQFGPGRNGGESGANPGRTLGQLGRASAALRV